MKHVIGFLALFLALAGCSSSSQVDQPVIIANSRILWSKCFGGSSYEKGYSISQTSDSGFIAAGSSISKDGDVSGNRGVYDDWIVKFDKSGTLEWQKNFGGSQYDEAFGIIQTSDGGYVAAGYSLSHDGNITKNNGGLDYWIMKIDKTGALQWQKSLGGVSDEAANSIIETTDGFLAAGYSRSMGGDVSAHHGTADSTDAWIVKLDKSGNFVWDRSFGGNGTDAANSIQKTSDGGFVIGGYSNSLDGDVSGNHGGYDCWIVKVDNSGVIEWQRSLGGSLDDVAASIDPSADGGYVIAGWSYSNDGNVSGHHGNSAKKDAWIVKTDDHGFLLWKKTLGGADDDLLSSIKNTTDGGFIVTGSSKSNDGDAAGNHGGLDYWVVKCSSTGDIQWQESMGGSNDDNGAEVLQTFDGSYVVCGKSNSNDGEVSGNHGNSDFWIVKLKQ